MAGKEGHIPPTETELLGHESKHLIKARKILAKAKDEELGRVDRKKNPEAPQRVELGFEKRLMPYIVENEKIAEQLHTRKYQDFSLYMSSYLAAEINGEACSDGRIYNGAIFDSLVGVVDKRPQGFFSTRPSGKDGVPVLNDHSIPAAISSTIKLHDLMREDTKAIKEGFEQREIFGHQIKDILAAIDTALVEVEAEDTFAFRPSILKPQGSDLYQNDKNKTQIIEFAGPHIDSKHPLHGCGAATAKGTQDGTPADVAMKTGGIDLYFAELGAGFNAFDNNARKAGGKGATFDMVHDSHSQGLIFGTREAYLTGEFDSINNPEELRSTLEELHLDGKIMMTELLDKQFGSKIQRIKDNLIEQLGIRTPLDLKDIEKYADNMILTALIAKRITEKCEEADPYFSWIPEHLKENKSQEAKRVLAYTSIRNCTYRNLNNIIPGEHDLINHPEQLLRVGPTGAAFNVNTKGFVHVTAQGRFTEDDKIEADKLKGLANKFMPQLPGELKADFEQEALIVLVTGKFDEKKYRIHKDDDDATKKETIISKVKDFERETGAVRGFASELRNMYADEIKSGKIAVVGLIFNNRREITHVLSSDSKNDNVDEALS